MKKFFVALLLTVFAASGVQAHDFDRHYFGIRAGVNVSNLSTEAFEALAGYHISGVYQISLSRQVPVFFETGIQFTRKGARVYNNKDIDVDIEGKAKVKPMYLQIPLMVNYKFGLGHDIALYPSVGFYYGVGIAGKVVAKDGSQKISDKLFGNDIANRSDFGFRISATADIRSFTVGLGYEAGFVNLVKDLQSDVIELPRTKPGNFYISLGINF